MAAAPRVTSMRFFRYGCDEQHHPLFQTSYSRSNRMHGVKILRCFPHCCPDHVPRRYCGCSLHLVVAFNRPLIRAEEQQFVVCARFEALTASEIVRGSKSDGAANTAVLMDAGTMARIPGHLSNEGAGGEESTSDQMWVRAVKESERRQQQVPSNAVVFSLNNRRFPKWIYNYERDATRQQRDMQHCLRAYVFQLHSARAEYLGDARSQLATVVAHLASPGFVLYSYRRASYITKRLDKVNSSDRSAVSNHCRSNVDDLDMEIDELRRNRDSISACESPLPDSESSVDISPEAVVKPRSNPDSLHPNLNTYETKHPQHLYLNQEPLTGGGSPVIDNLRLAQTQTTREKMQHLHILLLFLDSISLHRLQAHAETLTRTVEDRWLKPLFVAGMDPSMIQTSVSTFSMSTLLACHCSCSSCDHLLQTRSQCPHVVIDCVAAVMQVLNPLWVSKGLETSLGPGTDLDEQGSSTTRKGVASLHLLPAFERFIDEIYEALAFTVAQMRGVQSQDPHDPHDPSSGLPVYKLVGSLVDDVVSHIFQDALLSTIMPAVLDILRGVDTGARDAALYRKFVAQTVEMSVVERNNLTRNAVPRDIPADDSSALCNDQDLWRHRWLLNTHKLKRIDNERHLDTHTDAFGSSTTILGLLIFLNRYLCIDIALDGSRLTVTSAVGLEGHATEWSRSHSGMSLVLDGRSRVFRAFPDGVATMATLASRAEWSWGDYCGCVSDDHRSLELVLFCFRENPCRKSNVEDSDDLGEIVHATEVVRFDVGMTLRVSKGEATKRIWEGSVFRELSVVVAVSRSRCTSASGSNGDGDGDDDDIGGDLSGMSCLSRAEFFSRLEWRSVSSFDAIYDRVG